PCRFWRSARPPEGRRPLCGDRVARAGVLMTNVAVETRSEERPPRPRHSWPRRLLNELFALFVALLFLLACLLVLLHTPPGHRWIVDRIAGLETASGLRIRIGRIDGSIFGKSQL